MALAYALTWASAVDALRHILPNALTIGLILLGLVVNAVHNPDSLFNSFAGALLGYLLIQAVAYWFEAVRGLPGIGLGDAKLLSAAGAWVGALALPAVILASTTMGIAYLLGRSILNRRLDRDARIPFGPFIAVAFWFAWFFH